MGRARSRRERTNGLGGWWMGREEREKKGIIIRSGSLRVWERRPAVETPLNGAVWFGFGFGVGFRVWAVYK
jgi:hypothetical protein